MQYSHVHYKKTLRFLKRVWSSFLFNRFYFSSTQLCTIENQRLKPALSQLIFPQAELWKTKPFCTITACCNQTACKMHFNTVLLQTAQKPPPPKKKKKKKVILAIIFLNPVSTGETMNGHLRFLSLKSHLKHQLRLTPLLTMALRLSEGIVEPWRW